MAEYPHFSYGNKYAAKNQKRNERQRPKLLLYAALAVMTVIHFFFGIPYFYYAAFAFLGYALFKLFTCGCWKAQLRTLAALCLVALALGVAWRPLMAISVGLLAFEMFL